MISNNQITVVDIFFSQGYSPQQDGPLVFTFVNVAANIESNSQYGTFKIELYDNNVL